MDHLENEGSENFSTFARVFVAAITLLPNSCLATVVVAYTECPRRNVPDFGSVFLVLRYADIPQNTYVRS
jgi:hypothetical protein